MHITGPGPQRARILIVDHDAATARSLAGDLGQMLALPPVVAAARDGRVAMQRLRSEDFDVLLAALCSLDDLAHSAEEAVARLVRLSAGALVVAMAEEASVSAAMAVMRAGAHDYMVRPASGSALAARIRELGERHGKARALGFDTPVTAPAAPMVASDAAASSGRSMQLVAMRNPVLPMWRQEQRIIEEAIESFAGNIALDAAALELSPSTIYRKRQAWAEMDGKRGAA